MRPLDAWSLFTPIMATVQGQIALEAKPRDKKSAIHVQLACVRCVARKYEMVVLHVIWKRTLIRL